MVRAAARTAVLNCAGTPDARVRRWLLSPRAWSACAPRVVAHAGATTAALTDATLGATNDGPGASERSNLVAELVDLLHYVDDLASVPDPSERTGGEDFATRAEEELWSGLVEPTLMRSIAATNASDSSETDASASPNASVSPNASASPRTDAIVSSASPSRDAGPPIVSPATALFALSRLFASSTRRSILARASAALLRPTDAMGRPNPRRLAVVRALRGDRENLAAAAATAALTALVTSRHADVDELRAAGLRAAAEGDEAEMDDAREEMADALVDVVTRREPGAPAETRACAAFLLRRVDGTGTRTRDDDDDGERNRDDRTSVSESKRRRRLAALDEAAARDAASIVDEMDGPWIDVVGPLLAAEWTRARRGAERPTTREDAAVGAIREAAASAAGNARWGKNDASAAAGVRLIRAARAFALTAMLRDALVEDQPVTMTPTEFPDVFLGDAAATAAATGYPPPSAFARTETWKCARGRRFSCLARRSEVQTGTPRACRVAWRSKPVANVASFSSSRRASRARASPPPRYSSSPSRTHRREGTSGWFERWRRSRGAGRRLTRRIESGYTRACDRRNRASSPSRTGTRRTRRRRGGGYDGDTGPSPSRMRRRARRRRRWWTRARRHFETRVESPSRQSRRRRENERRQWETERRGKNERRGNNERRESRRREPASRAGVESRR